MGEDRAPLYPRKTRLRLIASTAVLVLVSAASFWAATLLHSPEQLAAVAGEPDHVVPTAPVEFRVLQDSIQTLGRITTRTSRSVEVGSVTVEHGTAIVSAMPLRQGSGVRSGSVLVEISGRPVFALIGNVPAYRDLYPGDHGRDVLQLQGALRRLGYGPFDAPGQYGGLTQAAVARLYRASGYEPAREPAAGGMSAGEQGSPSSPRRASGFTLPRSEIFYIPSLPARVDGLLASVGSAADGPLLAISSGPLAIDATLDQAALSLVHEGDLASMRSENPRLSVRGRVTSVLRSAGDGASADTQPGHVFITPLVPLAASLVGVLVPVEIVTSTTSRPVFVVPSTAVHTGPDGSQFVSRVGDNGGEIAVELGLAVGGYLEVRPVRGSLRAGDRVVVGTDSGS